MNSKQRTGRQNNLIMLISMIHEHKLTKSCAIALLTPLAPSLSLTEILKHVSQQNINKQNYKVMPSQPLYVHKMALYACIHHHLFLGKNHRQKFYKKALNLKYTKTTKYKILKHD